MRDPAIHLLWSDLKDILGLTLSVDQERELLIEFKSRSLNRFFVVSTAKQAQRITKKASVSDSFTKSFQGKLNAKRMALNHSGIREILQTDASYSHLENAVFICREFILHYDLDVDKGMEIFINLALEVMGRRYTINKFKFYKDKIFDGYESSIVIKADDDYKYTALLFSEYLSHLPNRSVAEKILRAPSTYLHFVYASLDARSCGATPKDWVDTQIEYFKKTFDKLPEPTQLYGDNSKLRYLKAYGVKEKALPSTRVSQMKEKRQLTYVGDY